MVVPAWMGSGSLGAAKLARDEGRLTSGTKATSARYLGDFINISGTNSTIIQKRIAAADTGFFAYAGVWRSRNISFKSKSLFFKNMVLNALLSGLKICVFNQGEINKLQVHADKLARRALGRRGWGAVKTTPTRQAFLPGG